jgi:heparan-alpha-glucosaminide N-acetyltransferase
MPQARNLAIDAYRGLVMLLMMAEVLQLGQVARAFPGNPFWAFLGYNQTHVEWAGCSLHDTIQPSFSFLVGVALPYSIAARLRKGETFPNLLAHTIWRSFLLIALGIFLRSMHSTQTNFTFEDTLTQIGLGYTFLFLLGFAKPRTQWIAFGAILFAYWLTWALYPVQAPIAFPHNYTGFAAHWNKNANLGDSFDQWFLNLFPRPQPFIHNDGGYLTLSFIPTLATMILGLVAGRWTIAGAQLKRFLTAGALCLAAGLLFHVTGICPVVKRIWTPAWTLFSGGVCFFFLAAFSWIIQIKGKQKWAYPLIVIGANSIAAYLIAHLCEDFLKSSFLINLGPAPFQILGHELQPLLLGAAILITYWLMLWWMYRRNVFLKI